MDTIQQIDKLSQEIDRRIIKEKLNLLANIYIEKTSEADIEIKKAGNMIDIAIDSIKKGYIEKNAGPVRVFRNWLGSRRAKKFINLYNRMPISKGVADARFLGADKAVKMEKLLSKMEADAVFARARPNLLNWRRSLNSSKKIRPSLFGLEGIPDFREIKSMLNTPLTPGKAAALGGGAVLGLNMLPKGMTDFNNKQRSMYMMTPNGGMVPMGM